MLCNKAIPASRAGMTEEGAGMTRRGHTAVIKEPVLATWMTESNARK
ncbi:hypothetical protein wVul_0362 [Wolbachia endosymbiont of Armadillidium vulgare str. wVulC]|nr:hypothetical protein wVul_0362 [Wolbachia endosymbiont of Armadillidium vulgare str. wVulC]